MLRSRINCKGPEFYRTVAVCERRGAKRLRMQQSELMQNRNVRGAGGAGGPLE